MAAEVVNLTLGEELPGEEPLLGEAPVPVEELEEDADAPAGPVRWPLVDHHREVVARPRSRWLLQRHTRRRRRMPRPHLH